MAKIIVSENATLDGVIEDPTGGEGLALGGWFDRISVLVADALFAFPSLLLAIVIVVAISGGSSGKWSGIFATAISITVVYVPQYFRVVRNATVAAPKNDRGP